MFCVTKYAASILHVDAADPGYAVGYTTFAKVGQDHQAITGTTFIKPVRCLTSRQEQSSTGATFEALTASSRSSPLVRVTSLLPLQLLVPLRKKKWSYGILPTRHGIRIFLRLMPA